MFRTSRMAPTVAAASAMGIMALAAPAHAGTNVPGINVEVTTKVSGNTVTLTYLGEGSQFMKMADGKAYSDGESAGFDIDYGDGTPVTGGDGMGGSTCASSGETTTFKDKVTGLKHTYAKPGTYTITVTGYYCGTTGNDGLTKKYKVTVGADGTTTTTPAKVGVTPHIRYTVKGNTATLTPYLTGTQHEMLIGGKRERVALPMSFNLVAPKGATQITGNAAGDSGVAACTTSGSVPMNTSALTGDPATFRFAGPGTYKVTLNATVCTGGAGQQISRSVNVTIPGATNGGSTTTPQAPTGSTPTKSGAAPAQGSAPKASEGPKVNTDYNDGDNSTVWGVGALAGAGLIGAGALATRRRRG